MTSMRALHLREVIRGVPARWAKHMKRSADITGERAHKLAQLEALDLETCTRQDIADIIGNASWTRLTCDRCKLEVELLLRLGADADFDEPCFDICLPCLADAQLFLNEAVSS